MGREVDRRVGAAAAADAAKRNASVKPFVLKDDSRVAILTDLEPDDINSVETAIRAAVVACKDRKSGQCPIKLIQVSGFLSQLQQGRMIQILMNLVNEGLLTLEEAKAIDVKPAANHPNPRDAKFARMGEAEFGANARAQLFEEFEHQPDTTAQAADALAQFIQAGQYTDDTGNVHYHETSVLNIDPPIAMESATRQLQTTPEGQQALEQAHVFAYGQYNPKVAIHYFVEQEKARLGADGVEEALAAHFDAGVLVYAEKLARIDVDALVKDESKAFAKALPKSVTGEEKKFQIQQFINQKKQELWQEKGPGLIEQHQTTIKAQLSKLDKTAQKAQFKALDNQKVQDAVDRDDKPSADLIENIKRGAFKSAFTRPAEIRVIASYNAFQLCVYFEAFPAVGSRNTYSSSNTPRTHQAYDRHKDEPGFKEGREDNIFWNSRTANSQRKKLLTDTLDKVYSEAIVDDTLCEKLAAIIHCAPDDVPMKLLAMRDAVNFISDEALKPEGAPVELPDAHAAALLDMRALWLYSDRTPFAELKAELPSLSRIHRTFNIWSKTAGLDPTDAVIVEMGGPAALQWEKDGFKNQKQNQGVQRVIADQFLAAIMAGKIDVSQHLSEKELLGFYPWSDLAPGVPGAGGHVMLGAINGDVAPALQQALMEAYDDFMCDMLDNIVAERKANEAQAQAVPDTDEPAYFAATPTSGKDFLRLQDAFFRSDWCQKVGHQVPFPTLKDSPADGLVLSMRAAPQAVAAFKTFIALDLCEQYLASAQTGVGAVAHAALGKNKTLTITPQLTEQMTALREKCAGATADTALALESAVSQLLEQCQQAAVTAKPIAQTTARAPASTPAKSAAAAAVTTAPPKHTAPGGPRLS